MSKNASVTSSQISFAHNHHAQSLFGQCNEYVSLIERALGIEMRTNGNHAILSGTKLAVSQAREVLQILYARLSDGESIAVDDVEGTIRIVTHSRSSKSGESKKSVKKSVSRIVTKKRSIHARTARQELYIDAMFNSQLIFGVGPAGTGKTYLAVAYGSMLLEKGIVDRIVLSRPAVEAGEQLGFLPGDMKDKVDPYLRPLYDALYDMFDIKKVEKYVASGEIEIAPLAFMRGRTLSNSAIILDEAQNTSWMQMKMFLTRLGSGSKMIVTGDPSQIDLPPNCPSGLTHALDILTNIPDITKVRFDSRDVARHGLVAKIVDAYDAASKNTDSANVKN